MKRLALCLAIGIAIHLLPGNALAQFNGGTPPALGPAEDPGCAKISLWEGVGWSACGLAKGLFVYSHTDLTAPGPMPITLRRTYRSMGGPSVGFGPGWSFDYAMFLYPDGSGVDVVMPDGGRIYCANTGLNTYSCTSVPDSTWYAATISYDPNIPNGGGWDLTRKDRTVYKFGYNAPLQSITDRNGNTVTLVRSGQTGNITQIADSNGRSINLTWTNGLITQAQEVGGSNSLTVTYSYDGSGRLSSVQDFAGFPTTYAYSTVAGETNNITSITDAISHTTTLAYTSSTGSGQAPLGSLSTITLNLNGTNEPWGFSYTADANSNIQNTTITDGLGTTRLITFNSAGYVTSDTIGNNQTGTLHQYSQYNRDPATNFVTDQYDPLWIGNAARHTVFSWDFVAGDLLSVTKAAGTTLAATTSYTYDSAHCYFVETATDPVNNVTTRSYDSACNLSSITDGNTHTTTFPSYNAQGQVLQKKSPLSETTSYGYDSLGNLTTVTDALGHQATTSYDGLGRITGLADALGNTTLYTYDVDSRVQDKQPPGSPASIQYQYDNVGNLTSLVDLDGKTWSWTYDTLNHIDHSTDPNSHTIGYQYDANENMTQILHDGTAFDKFEYDAINRKVTERFGWNTSTSSWDSVVTYTYDIGNRVTSAVDSKDGTVSRNWDGLDRLSSETEPKNTTTTLGTVSYTYDAAGNVKTMVAGSDPTVNYGYDGDNQLASVQNDLGTVSISHDADERRSQVSLPNGITGAYTYDAASRMTDLVYSKGVTVVGDLHYTYDAANRTIEVSGSLAGINLPNGTGMGVTTGTFTYNADSSPHTYTATGSSATTYSNDSVGDLTSGGDGNNYDWSTGRGVPKSFGAWLGTGCATQCEKLLTDPYGRRTFLNYVNSTPLHNVNTTTYYLYQGQNVVQELGPNGEARVLNGLGLDERYARRNASGVVSWFLVDRMGSTVALSDVNGNIQTTYTYGPFGQTAVAGTSNDNPYQFQGREAEPMNGLFGGMYYYRARFLDTGLSRFVSRDPAGFQGGQHLYNYGGNAPTMASDPTGEDVYQAGYVVGLFYGYTIGFAYGVEAFVDPTAANSLTGAGTTTASDVGFGASAYGAMAGEALSTASLVGLVAYFTKLALYANANAAAAAQAYGEAFGTNAESVAAGGGVIAGAPPPGPVSPNWAAFLQEQHQEIKVPVAPKNVSVPTPPTSVTIDDPCAGSGGGVL